MDLTSWTDVFVKEGSDAVLPCFSPTNLVAELFDWRKIVLKGGKQKMKEVFLYQSRDHYNNGRLGQDEQFKGRVLHFEGALKDGNASIILQNTTLDDSGEFTCAFPHLQPNTLTSVRLIVVPVLRDRSGENRLAVSRPFITIADVTQFGVLLRCDVQDVKLLPKLQWQDGDGNILPAEETQVSERGGRSDITLQTTVSKTKTNRFHCVVTQEEIGHVTDRNITVSEKLFEDKCSTVDITGWLGGFFLGVSTLAAGQVLLVAVKKRCNKDQFIYNGFYQHINNIQKSTET